MRTLDASSQEGRDLLFSSKTNEKVSRALYILASQDKPLKDRLAKACMELSMLNGRKLPKQFEEDFNALRATFSAFGPETPGEGEIHASIRKLKKDEAAYFARQIVNFALNVSLVTRKP